jgi:competence protein ComEC
MTIVAQLGVLGLIIYNFESFSLFSLLANLIILPIIPIIMLGGFLVLVLSFFVPFLTGFLAIPVQILLDFEIWVVSFLADFKWASVEFSNLSIWWLFAYYIFFIGLILKYRKS